VIAEQGDKGAASTDQDQQTQAVSLFTTDMLAPGSLPTLPTSHHRPTTVNFVCWSGPTQWRCLRHVRFAPDQIGAITPSRQVSNAPQQPDILTFAR
jgi:hypothetical protein